MAHWASVSSMNSLDQTQIPESITTTITTTITRPEVYEMTARTSRGALDGGRRSWWMSPPDELGFLAGPRRPRIGGLV